MEAEQCFVAVIDGADEAGEVTQLDAVGHAARALHHRGPGVLYP